MEKMSFKKKIWRSLKPEITRRLWRKRRRFREEKVKIFKEKKLAIRGFKKKRLILKRKNKGFKRKN